MLGHDHDRVVVRTVAFYPFNLQAPRLPEEAKASGQSTD